jgi:NAD+ kinase
MLDLSKIKLIGIYPDKRKEETVSSSRKLANFLKKEGCEVCFGDKLEEALDKDEEIKIDFIVTLGGDGTLIRIASKAAVKQIPILSVNMGHLGFLTEITFSELYNSLVKISKGDYYLDERSMLYAKVLLEGEMTQEVLALNDIVFYRGSSPFMVYLNVYVNEVFLNTFTADGLIISTATGSTAYSFSAGGPVLEPSMETLILTPIAPHTFSARSLLFPPKTVIKINNTFLDRPAFISIDGQGYIPFNTHEVIITNSPHKTKLIRFANNFFEILRKKLKW